MVWLKLISFGFERFYVVFVVLPALGPPDKPAIREILAIELKKMAHASDVQVNCRAIIFSFTQACFVFRLIF